MFSFRFQDWTVAFREFPKFQALKGSARGFTVIAVVCSPSRNPKFTCYFTSSHRASITTRACRRFRHAEPLKLFQERLDHVEAVEIQRGQAVEVEYQQPWQALIAECWTWDQIFAEDKTSEKKSIMQLQCKGFPIANHIPGINAQLELATPTPSYQVNCRPSNPRLHWLHRESSVSQPLVLCSPSSPAPCRQSREILLPPAPDRLFAPE